MTETIFDLGSRRSAWETIRGPGWADQDELTLGVLLSPWI